MKKIGILTFHNADNYGALLQAYALKKSLKDMGHNTHIINYYCPKLQRDYKIFKLPKFSIKDIIKQIIKYIFSPLSLYIRHKFKGFRRQYLSDTEPYYPDTITNCSGKYDMFITGSDQVFNPRLTDYDRNYFLSFCKDKCKKFSYAASFGLELSFLSNKDKQFLKENLKDFSAVSVREEEGNNIIKNLLSRESEVNLDPTLLLKKEVWQKIAVAPEQKKYVLLYLMYNDKDIINFAKKIAKKNKCKVLFISHCLDIKKRVPAEHITPSVQEWLGLFLNAEYIITNSFHGFAFSVNFNKKFFLGRLPNNWTVNSRLDNLLDLTGLHNRLYTNFKTDTDYDADIDWQSVNDKLEAESQKSLNYLKEITK